MIKFLLLV